jgi:4-amino-4-deoxy-L-arabinose transferase-like glycosyltransferase
MKRTKFYVFILLLFFVLLFSLRIIHTGADPPKNLSTSLGYMGDPGAYAFNSKNKITFNRWEMDMWNIMHISPLPHYVTYFFFRIFGAGIAQMNLVPIFFSFLVILFSYLILQKKYIFSFALLGTFLLGINYQFIMFSRIAVRVMPMLLFVLLALYFLGKNLEKKTWIFLAGVCCFIAFTVKGTFFQIFPAIGLGMTLYVFFQNKKKFKNTVGSIVIFLSGVGFTFIPWLLIFYLPHKQMFLDYAGENIDWLTPQGLYDVLENFWRRPLFYFNEMPILTMLASLSLLILFFKVFTSPKKISLLNWICSLWFISSILYFSVISYQAARHFSPLTVPITFLALFSLHEFFNLKTIRKPEKNPLLFYPLLFVWLIYPLSCLFILNSRPVEFGIMRSKFFLILGISLVLTGLIYLLLKLWPKKLQIPLPKAIRVSIVLILAGSSAFLNLKPYLQWAISPRYDVKNISTDLGKAFENMSIGGLLAPVISLENQHEAHPYRNGYINPYKDFMERFSITHVLWTIHGGEVEKKEYTRDFPQVMKKARLIARYYLWRTYAELYDLNPKADQREEGATTFEGETFYGKAGIPRYDKDASGKLAFLAEKGKKGSSLQLPDLKHPKGKYRAIFRLKAESRLSAKTHIARIDVVDRKTRKVFAYRLLYDKDFTSPDAYLDFALDFTLSREREITLRGHTTGITNLWIDKVSIKMQ